MPSKLAPRLPTPSRIPRPLRARSTAGLSAPASSGRVMKKRLARRREPYTWWLGLRPRDHAYRFLSGTKAFSSRS
jgi:hypothetical protein